MDEQTISELNLLARTYKALPKGRAKDSGKKVVAKQAVDLILSEKTTQREVALALNVTQSTISQWVKEFKPTTLKSFVEQVAMGVAESKKLSEKLGVVPVYHPEIGSFLLTDAQILQVLEDRPKPWTVTLELKDDEALLIFKERIKRGLLCNL